MRTSGFLKTSEGSKYLLCDGSEIPSTYPKLRSLMTHTPDLRDRVPQGAGTYATNTKIEAALPNIYGEASWTYLGYLGYHYFMGAINYTPEVKLRGTSGWTAGADLGSNYTLIFNASEYNSIYKDECTTVQPPALAVAFYIKAK